MPAGRPTLYRDDYPDQARRLHLLGMTDEEVANFFGVHKSTIYEWDARYPKFADSRARGKEAADGKVAEKLYHRALGYSHQAVKIFMPAGASKPVHAPYTEHFPPDTQAATWWLKNRQPKKWRERQEVTGPDGGPIQSVTVTTNDPVEAARVYQKMMSGEAE